MWAVHRADQGELWQEDPLLFRRPEHAWAKAGPGDLVVEWQAISSAVK